MKPEISVIIPHYNDPARLSRCLEALVPQVTDDVEIVVADNGSELDLSQVKDAFPSVRFVVQPEKGAGPARNKGVQSSAGPVLMFIDADCVPSSDWLEVGRAAASTDAIIGGRVSIFHETDPPRSGAEVFEEIFAFDQEKYIRDHGFSVTANLVASRAAFERTGCFRTAVSEDVDWCRRATANGLRLSYLQGLNVAHPSRSDWPSLIKKWRRVNDELFQLHLAENRGRLSWCLRGLAMPISAFVHLPSVLFHSGFTGSERLAGALTLFRLRAVRLYWMLGQSIGHRSDKRMTASG